MLRNFGEIRGAVEQMERKLEQFKAAVGKIENRAVFEIPDMLARILEENNSRSTRTMLG